MHAQLQQQIFTRLQDLTSRQLAEVLDFVEFLQYRQRPAQTTPDIIDALCGKYEQRLSSSTAFAQSKQEEIQREEEKWRGR
jgi:hypothetical protein